MSRHHIPEMTWQETGFRFEAGAIVLLPIGANEGHGHHLPLSTDTVIATHVCEQVADRIAEAIVKELKATRRSDAA